MSAIIEKLYSKIQFFNYNPIIKNYMKTKTIREIALAWKSDKQRYVKQSTYAAYVLILENHLLP